MAKFIEFPIFTGVAGELRPWISWLEAFFVREKFTADEKMNLAQSLLEGEANAWFYSSRKRFAFQSWEHLVVEILLWRFGYFDDGGVFSDVELFLLWDKYDQVEKRRKRRETTSLHPHESISSPAVQEIIPVDKFFTPQVAEISGEKTESKKEVESQVHVSDSDRILQKQRVAELSGEKKESKQEVDLSMEKIASQLKLPNTKSEIVSNNRVLSQAGVGCVKNKNNAHHVFDELFRMLHDPGGKKDEHFDEIFETEVDIGKVQRTQMACDAAIDVVGWDAFGKEENLFSVLSQASQVWEPGGVLKLKEPVGLVNQKKSRCLQASLFNFKRKKKRSKRRPNQLQCNYASVREFEPTNLPIVSRLFGFNVVSFRCHKEYGLARMNNWSQVRADYSLLQGKLFVPNDFTSNGMLDGDWPENAVLHLQKSVYGLTQASRHWYLNFSTTLMALGFTKSLADQMFHRQQTSSSIWHRWRRKPLFLLHFWKKICWYQRLFFQSGLIMWQLSDLSGNSWMFSIDFVSLYPTFKLEDKLVFEGGSIDTIQSHFSLHVKPPAETEGLLRALKVKRSLWLLPKLCRCLPLKI